MTEGRAVDLFAKLTDRVIGRSLPSIGEQKTRIGGLLSLGLFEQALLSGSSFVFTVQMARAMGETQFGAFSVVWSIVMLVETSLWGIFGEAIPSTMHRVRAGHWRKLRGGLFVLSAASSGALALLFWLAAAISIRVQPAATWPLFFAGATLVGMRAQNMFRRICYVDHMRGPTAASAVVYAIALLSLALILKHEKLATPAGALLALAVASLAASSVVWTRLADIRRPNRRLLVWLGRRLWRTGRWVFVSSILSWAGNLGIIPLSGLLVGINASGALRAVQTVVTPMSQATTVMSSILVPRAAKELRQNRRMATLAMVVRSIGLFLMITMPYAVAVSFVGPSFFQLLFGRSFAGVNAAIISVAVLGFALESIRFGCNVPLLGSGHTRIIFINQCISLVSLFILLPIAALKLGFFGIVLAMTGANNVGTVFTLGYTFVQYRRKLAAA